MPAWATVALTLGVALIGAVTTLAGIVLQQRYSREERRQAEHEARVREASLVVGELFTLLVDADPSRLGVHRGLDAETLTRLDQRWLDLRDRLSQLLALHYTLPIGETVGKLIGSVTNLLGRLASILDQLPGGSQANVIEARRERNIAVDATSRLLREVHGVAGDNESDNESGRDRPRRCRRRGANKAD